MRTTKEKCKTCPKVIGLRQKMDNAQSRYLNISNRLGLLLSFQKPRESDEYELWEAKDELHYVESEWYSFDSEKCECSL